jgi:hypothetical protein
MKARSESIGETEMTNQEIFDFVVRALLKQGRPAYDGNQCRYRTSDGRKCAIGHLIPDEKYTPAMESYSPTREVVYKGLPFEASGILQVFLKDLQFTHDSPACRGLDGPRWVEAFAEEAREFAIKNNLNFDVTREPGQPS